jgi:hypothetical protein
VPLPIRQSLAAAAALLSSVITLAAAGGFTAGALLTAFFSAAVTPLAAAAFSAALGGKDQIPASVPRRAAGVLLLLFAVTGSLTAAPLPFDAGKIFAFGAPLILARRGSPPGRNSFFPAAAGLV